LLVVRSRSAIGSAGSVTHRRATGGTPLAERMIMGRTGDPDGVIGVRRP
jgi:hypothetical protein